MRYSKLAGLLLKVLGVMGIIKFASVMLTDVVVPDVYLSYTQVNSPELTAFFDSGVAVTNDALINAFAQVPGGNIANLPFWNDLDTTSEPNYTTDNPADVATPDKVTANMMITRIADMNKGYSAADLVAELAGSSPMERIRSRFSRWWDRQWQHRLIAAMNGLLAENVATNSADMVLDISLQTTVGITDYNLFTRKAFTGAAFSLGDHFGELACIAVHSIVYKRMVDNDDINFIPPSTPDPRLPLSAQMVPQYLGKTVIIDDGMPVIAGTGNPASLRFVSILFGLGAIGYADGLPNIPVEVYRRPDEGNGGGVEQLWERKRRIIHPFGYQFTSTSVAGFSPTNAEMATAANWARMVDRRNVPIAFLITNG